jgi:Prohead core protein serine protease
MKLIRELNEETKILTEEVDGKKNLFVEGICIQTNVQNRNKRVYPKGNVEKEINRYIKEHVHTKRALGELNHPTGIQVNLERASHLFESLTQDGDNYLCKARILDTPMGNIARGLIEGGAQLGISTRALGSVKANRQGIMEVQNDFHLATAGDLVGDPSAPDAWLNAINESVDWVYVNGMWTEQAIDNMKTIIKTKPSAKASLLLWEDFLVGIATK